MTEDVWWFPACLHRQRAGRWDGKPCPVCHMPGINMSTLSKYEFIYYDAVSAYPKYLETMPATYLQFHGVDFAVDHLTSIAPTNSGKTSVHDIIERKKSMKLIPNSLYGKKREKRMGHIHIKTCDHCVLVIGDRESSTDIVVNFVAARPFPEIRRQESKRKLVHTVRCAGVMVAALMAEVNVPGTASFSVEVRSHEGDPVR